MLAAACRHWQSLAPRLGAVLLGQLVCYALGTAWFMFVMQMGLLPSLAACVFPFILPDFLKGLAAVLLARALRARLG